MSEGRIAVGIPSFREADSIGHVVRQVDAGLTRAFGASRCTIVSIDGASPDGTSEVFRHVPTACPKTAIVVAAMPGGKGRNVLEFLEYGRRRRVAAMAIVDADVRSVTPEWPEALLGPVVAGKADWVSPMYLRSRYEGAATAHFAYPFVSAVTGLDIRQPIGGDFGFSSRLASGVLGQRHPGEVEGYGIDIFMTLHAARGGFRIVQAALGRKVHKPSFPKRARIFQDVVATAVAAVGPKGLISRAVDPLELPCGVEDDRGAFPDPASLEALVATARVAAAACAPVYRRWVGRGHPGLSEALAETPRLSAAAWADILAAALVAQPVDASAHDLAERLVPLYSIRSATLWGDSEGRPPGSVEAEILAQARTFRERLRVRLAIRDRRRPRRRPGSGPS